MVDVDALITKARAANENAADDNWIEVSTLFGDELAAIRFDAILGSAWASLTASHPPREDSKPDEYYGFDTDAVLRAYPEHAIRVAGDRIGADAWHRVLAVLDAPTLANCRNAIWALNQYAPAARIAAAKKAMAGASRKKPN
jgi:hypothetical protein